ncbi:NAD(P)-binding protein [Hypomontagnella monticulosa]|nr:NAD(P)-binding protein [Hypomontagnella monticulosa]
MDITGNAFVTGGGSGIGKACCIAMAQEGARGLLVADIDLKAAQKTVAEAVIAASNPSFRGEAIEIDVSDEESVKRAVAHMAESFGRIDYCVHSAGIPPRTDYSMGEARFAELKDLLGVHVHGTFLVTNLVTAAMKSQELRPVDATSPQLGGIRGAIVTMGSVASLFAPPGMVQYSSSKYAVLAITRTVAIENAAHGIRANCLCPTWVDTPLMRQTMEATPGDTVRTLVDGKIPMNRIGYPKEIADSAIFLCSPRSSFITGIALPIDGGMTLM